MAESTGISWADATFNPWVGCEKVSPGCLGAHCYAEVLVTGSGPRQLNRPGTWGPDGTRSRTSESTWGKPRRWERLAKVGILPNGVPNLDGHRPRVFCASLADVFEPRPELEPWRLELFALIEATPSLDWLLLTKRPEEARDWMRNWYEEDLAGPAASSPLFRNEGDENWHWRDELGWGVLPNIWIGASIENARFTWRADVLREIPAAVRFLSCEPLVGSLYESRPLGRSGSAEFTAVEDATGGAPERAAGASPEPLGRQDPTGEAQADVASQGMRSAIGVDVPKREPGPRSRVSLDLTGIDWVIVGGESGGRNARPMHPAWAREIRDNAIWGDMVPCGDGCCEPPRPRPALFFKQWGSWTPAVPPADQGVLATDVCVSENGERYQAGFDYVCFPNESDGVLMRYRGAAPKSGGKRLDGVEWCEFPAPALALA